MIVASAPRRAIDLAAHQVRPQSRMTRMLTLLLLLLTFSLSGAAAECVKPGAKPIHVALSDLGYGAYEAQGQIVGLLPDMLRELERRSGCTLVFELRPRARAVFEFLRGDLGLLVAALQTAERDQVGQFIPYGYTEMDLVLRDDVPPGIDSFAALERQAGLQIGVAHGITLGPTLNARLEQLLADKRAEHSRDFHIIASKLRMGRIHAAIIPFNIHAKLSADGELGAGIRIVDLPEVSPEVLGIYLHRGHIGATDRALLQRHLQDMVREGWVQRLYARYYGEAKIRSVFARGAPLLP